MTLTALIGAYHESSDPGDGLRATLPLAGRTLVERQARLAAEAGARPIVLFLDREPGDLMAAIDRLRADGLDILVAKSAGEAAKAVQANDRVLLMADGLLPDEGQVERMAGIEGNALLTVPDLRFDDRFERIDAESRWGGLAMLDGQTLKHTAAMLQDWDLQSTLLRRAVQNGARHIGLSGDPAGAHVILAERATDLAEIESSILESASAFQKDWVSRYLLGPLEQWATRRLLPTPAQPAEIWLAGLILTALSALAFSRAFLWTGLFLYLLATPLDGIGERLTRLRMRSTTGNGWTRRLTPLAAAGSFLALGYALSRTEGWGAWVLAAAGLSFSVALFREALWAPLSNRLFLAEHKGAGWLVLPFATAGFWIYGLGAAAVYAAASFFWIQADVHQVSAAAAAAEDAD